MKLVCWSNKTNLADCCCVAARTWFLQYQWEEAMAMCLSEPWIEAENIFDYVQVPLPKLSKKVEAWSTLILINHNRVEDSIADRDRYNIDTIIDNAALDITCDYPLMVRTDKVWSVGTLIAEIFVEQVYVPTKEEATLLLVAIASETFLSDSPQTTQRDTHACEWLNEIAWIEDIAWFVQELSN